MERPLNPLAGTDVLRATLLGPDSSQIKAVLLLTLHRVAGSHHSLALLGEQLAAAYAALKSSSKLETGSGLQFLDVLHLQRQPRQLQKYKGQRLFWLRQLAYAPPKLFLPYDEAEEGMNRQPGSAACITFMVRLQFCDWMHACMTTCWQGRSMNPYTSEEKVKLCQSQVPGDLTCKLTSVAASCGATLFMALMATWQVRSEMARMNYRVVLGVKHWHLVSPVFF